MRTVIISRIERRFEAQLSQSRWENIVYLFTAFGEVMSCKASVQKSMGSVNY